MAEDESTEISLCSAYCVVYTLTQTEWVVTGKGWTQVHVYRDKLDGSHRIVGWTVLGFEVVINANVTSLCKYKKKKEDFHKFTDEENTTYGFGFYKHKESSYEDSLQFMNTILNIIGNESKVEPVKKEMTRDLGTPEPSQEDIEKQPYLAIGKLRIGTPKVLQNVGKKTKAKAPRISISHPYAVSHDAHVKYNPENKTFEGLPKAWEGELKRQFGVDPAYLECERVDRYAAPIPSILVLMKTYLWKVGALQIEGLFRIAADADQCVYVKKQLNENTFTGCEDVHCISNLLKVWFRDLPRAVLYPISAEAIEACNTEEDAAAIIRKLPEPNNSIFLWLVDLCVEVQVESSTNKMTGKNLAIVFGPNLFNPACVPASADPMATMRFSQKVANFFHKAILYREKQTRDDTPAPPQGELPE